MVEGFGDGSVGGAGPAGHAGAAAADGAVGVAGDAAGLLRAVQVDEAQAEVGERDDLSRAPERKARSSRDRRVRIGTKPFLFTRRERTCVDVRQVLDFAERARIVSRRSRSWTCRCCTRSASPTPDVRARRTREFGRTGDHGITVGSSQSVRGWQGGDTPRNRPRGRGLGEPSGPVAVSEIVCRTWS